MKHRALLLLLPLLAGCYAYRPLGNAVPERGDAVRVELTAPAEFRLTDLTATGVTRAQGEVIRWAPDTVALSAFELGTAGGRRLEARGETVRFPATQLQSAEIRRFSWLRTAGLAAGIILAGVLSAELFDEGGGGGGGGGGIEPQ